MKMNWKIISFALMVLAGGVNLISGIVGDKVMEDEIQQRVDEAVDKRLNDRES